MTMCSLDVEGAFLEANLPEPIFMRLSDDVANVVRKMNPQTCGNKKGIIVKLKKALYGLVTASKLWYDRLKGVLIDIGLAIHPYDPCVFMGKYRDSLIVLSCYVDDILLCYAGSNDIPELLVIDLKRYFTEVKLDKSDPLIHVGLQIKSLPDGCIVSMSRYEQDVIEFCGIGDKKLMCPNLSDMFDPKETNALDTTDSKMFHTIVAKLLYLAKRTRPDILTVISLLCSRVQSPTQYDKNLLGRVVCYINDTIGYGLKFSKSGCVGQLNTYCDAAYGIDEGFKSRSGIVISYGGAPVYAKSGKQTIVTKSSAEAELVSLCDGVGTLLACRNFVEGLGVSLSPSVVHEDNQAVLELVKADGPYNMRTRHMSIKLFFIKQFVDKGILNVVYCNTDVMLADLLTKALTGPKFRVLRDLLLVRG